MTRVTFGVSCSPFLATQALQDIATQVADSHPLASTALRTTFYVDDCLTGTDTENQAIELRREVRETLQRHQLTVKKWRSNSPVVLGTIPDHLREREPTLKPYGPQRHLKTLGIHWDARKDTFQVSTSKMELTRVVTKRTLASDVAQTFDVLGWFSPTTILMKFLIQELWKNELGWQRFGIFPFDLPPLLSTPFLVSWLPGGSRRSQSPSACSPRRICIPHSCS